MNNFYSAATLRNKHLVNFIVAGILTAVFCLCQSLTWAQNSRRVGGPFIERNFNEESALDALPPVITYTPLASTCVTGNRTLTATITDVDGVPTSGPGLPVLYWRINSGPWTPVTGIHIGSGQYNFTFGGAAIAGNIVSYYIVAQDNAATPNVIARPSAGAGGYSANPPDAATEPTTPDFYVIQTTLAAGTYLVGAGQTYLTITDAINAYNNSCLSGPVVFSLVDASYGPSETFPILISNPSASAVNTLTIKPNTATNATVTGSSADALIKFNGADFVTIDGSNNNSNSRNLTFINTNTGTNSAVLWMASFSASNGSTNNTIKNCVINGNAATTTFSGIVQGSGVTLGNTAEIANNNNVYQNNSINTCYNGIYINGPLLGGETGTVVVSNLIGSTNSARKLGYRALYVAGQTGMSVSLNTVTGVNSQVNTGAEPDASGGIFVGGVISGGNIFSNRINDIRNSNTTGAPSYGISLQSASPSAGLRVHNNFIWEVAGYGKASAILSNGHGIAILSGGNYGIYYNSVLLNSTYNQTTAGISCAIYIGSSSGGTLDLRNNIFSNRQSIGTRYAIYCALAFNVFATINYNNYFSSGLLGYLNSTPVINIGGWQFESAQDGNSVATNPIFVSVTDLHMQLISPMNDQGTAIPGITTDIDGDSRSATIPDIGADEFTPPPCTANLGGTASASATVICISGKITLVSTGFSFGVGITYQWESSPNNTVWTPIPGETNPTSANPPTISATTYYRLRVTCTASGTAYSTTVTVTVNNPQVLSVTPASRCGTGTVNLSATSNSGTIINWYAAATGGSSLGTGATFTTPSISATTNYYVEALYTGSNGTCGPVSPTAQGGTISTQLTSWDVFFDVNQATTLISVDVFPLAAGETSTLEVFSPAGTVLASIPYTTTVSGGTTAQTIPLNVFLPADLGYYLYASAGLPPTGLTRNISGATYPYASTDISIVSNGFNQTFFMCYYNWKFSNGCASTRTAVTASVVSPPSVTATASPTIVCLGTPSTLTASSANPSYTYSWMPGSLTGASVSVTPSINTTYTVTASDGSCVTSTTVSVTVKEIPAAVSVTPGSVTKCATTAPQLLTASGGAAFSTILQEGFNGAGVPAGWSTTVAPAGAAPGGFTLRPNNYSTAGYTFRSNDMTQFYLANSNATGAAYNTTIVTPAVNLTGYTSATLSFYHFYLAFSGDSIEVQWSATGAPGNAGWNVLWSHKITQLGTNTNFVLRNVDISARAGFATTYFRWRFVGDDDFFWAIDNATITASAGASPFVWSPTAGLFTNAAGTIPYTGAATPTIYANPSATQVYTASATSANGCSSTGTATVNVYPLVTGVISPVTTSICLTSSATISIALTGTAPWSLTYTDGTTPVTVNNILTSPYTFVVSPLVTTTYSITALSDVNCTATAPNFTSNPTSTVNVNPSLISTWEGISTDWTDPANWCGGIPTATKDIVIPTGKPFYPVITGLTPIAKDIAINAGGSITINAGGSLTVTGSVTNDGILSNSGTITLNGTSAQNFPGVSATGSIPAMNILEVNKASGTTTFNKQFGVWGVLKPTAGAITINDTITIHSNASGTASIDKVGASASFTYGALGKFTVERYVPTGTGPGQHGKSWQLLAPSTFGQTVNAAWQEGATGPASNPKPGYGTTITSNLPGALGLGFDFATPAGGTMKIFNSATYLYDGIANTNALQIANPKGYMLFVRGDRSVTAYNQAAVPVTLRTTGKVYAPGSDAPASVPVTVNKFECVGNPYASAIDFTSVLSNSTGLNQTYYVWDPLLPGNSGFGGFQTISNSNGYLPVPGGTANYSSSIAYSKIQSGQAFFVFSTPGGTVGFSENNKVDGNQMVLRGAANPSEISSLRLNIYNGDALLVDGNLVVMNRRYSNGVDANDAKKLSNMAENVSIRQQGELLAIDARNFVRRQDTIHYNIANLRTGNYELRFAPNNLNWLGMNGLLVDRFRNIQLPVSLGDTTYIRIDITADPLSRAADRFYMVFEPWKNVPTPYATIGIRQGVAQVLVDWEVTNASAEAKTYQLERTIDKVNLAVVGEPVAAGNSNYVFPDPHPLKETVSYYRVKTVYKDGNSQFSEWVKASLISENAEHISVNPNPVQQKTIHLYFNNAQPGDHIYTLINARGQEVYQNRTAILSPKASVQLKAGKQLSAGAYWLRIRRPDGSLTTLKVVLE